MCRRTSRISYGEMCFEINTFSTDTCGFIEKLSIRAGADMNRDCRRSAQFIVSLTARQRDVPLKNSPCINLGCIWKRREGVDHFNSKQSTSLLWEEFIFKYNIFMKRKSRKASKGINALFRLLRGLTLYSTSSFKPSGSSVSITESPSSKEK